MTASDENPLRPEHFARQDENDDSAFYREPRLVTHIDDNAIAALTHFYGDLLPPDSAILDLMSSWVSHLPEGRHYVVTGLGMNEAELDENPMLSRRVVQDLNRDQLLAFADAEFDGAVVTVSVQYLTSPVEVFAEVGRVLKPGAPFAVAYSNRCFPTKAVAIWRALNDQDHADLIGLYFRLSGQFESPQAFDITPAAEGYTDPMLVVVARKLSAEA